MGSFVTGASTVALVVAHLVGAIFTRTDETPCPPDRIGLVSLSIPALSIFLFLSGLVSALFF